MNHYKKLLLPYFTLFLAKLLYSKRTLQVNVFQYVCILQKNEKIKWDRKVIRTIKYLPNLLGRVIIGSSFKLPTRLKSKF